MGKKNKRWWKDTSQIGFQNGVKNSNILDVKTKNYGEKCGWCEDETEKEEIRVPIEIYCIWMTLMIKMGNKEWGGTYDVVDGMVSNFRIPRQNVSGAECEFLEDLGGNGVIHSHHTMGSFHSGQDERHCRNNYDCSIVISDSAILCTRKVTLPCSGFGYKKMTVLITGCPEIDMAKFEEKKIEVWNGDVGKEWDWRTQRYLDKVEKIQENATEKKSGAFICDACTTEKTGVFYENEQTGWNLLCEDCYKELEKDPSMLEMWRDTRG